jgi:hypothetical protein
MKFVIHALEDEEIEIYNFHSKPVFVYSTCNIREIFNIWCNYTNICRYIFSLMAHRRNNARLCIVMLSSLARTLGFWFRILPKAWMSVCVSSVFMCRLWPCDTLITRPRYHTDSLRIRNWSETERYTDAYAPKWEQQERKREREREMHHNICN